MGTQTINSVPFALRCLHLDGAAHHIHDVFGDGHAKAGALDSADRGGALPLEGLKRFFGKLRAHADAVILDAELVLPAACTFRQAGDPHRDRAARRVNLMALTAGSARSGSAGSYRSRHPRRSHPSRPLKLQLFCVDLPADDGFQIVQHSGKVDFHLFQMDLSAFDAAHIQHIVDEESRWFSWKQAVLAR